MLGSHAYVARAKTRRDVVGGHASTVSGLCPRPPATPGSPSSAAA
jgi:hypothetical protein